MNLQLFKMIEKSPVIKELSEKQKFFINLIMQLGSNKLPPGNIIVILRENKINTDKLDVNKLFDFLQLKSKEIELLIAEEIKNLQSKLKE
jgi:hypothetical protein